MYPPSTIRALPFRGNVVEQFGLYFTRQDGPSILQLNALGMLKSVLYNPSSRLQDYAI